MDRRRFFQLGKKLVVYIPPIKLYLKTIRTCFANHVRHFGSIEKYKKNMWPLFSTPGKEICQKIPQYDHLPPSTSNIKVATLLPGLAYPVRAQGAVSHGVPQCAIDVVGPCVAHKVHDASDGGMPSRTLQPYRKTFTSLDCSCQPTLSNTFVCASLGFMSTHSRREQ